MNRLKTTFYHPFLSGLFPILFLYAHNHSYIAFQETLVPGLVVLLATALLLPLAKWVTRTWQKAAILVSIWWLLFFSYKALSLYVVDWLGEEWSRHTYLLSFTLLFLGGIALVLRRQNSPLHQLSKIVNAFAFILILFPLSQIIYFQFNIAQSKASTKPEKDAIDPELKTDPLQKPDIVYLILDGYGRPDVLQSAYGMDLLDFTTFLKQQDFFIASQSLANYSRTAVSLASSLNMEYVQQLPAYHPKQTYLDLQEITERARLLRLLSREKYQLFGFASSFGNAELTKLAAYVSPYSQIRPLPEMLFAMSPLQIIEENGFLYKRYTWVKTKFFNYKEAPKDSGQRHYETLHHALENVPNYIGLEKPSFVFADIFVAHPPFVFTEDGAYRKPLSGLENLIADGSDVLTSYPGGKEAYKQHYKAQVLYLNKRIMTLVKRLKKNMKRPTVIILQGDHGPGANYHQEELTETNLEERFPILNAIYVTKPEAIAFPQDLTPVNTFRYLLNHFFQTKLPLLPNRHYFSPASEPANVVEVTQLLRPKEEK